MNTRRKKTGPRIKLNRKIRVNICLGKIAITKLHALAIAEDISASAWIERQILAYESPNENGQVVDQRLKSKREQEIEK